MCCCVQAPANEAADFEPQPRGDKALVWANQRAAPITGLISVHPNLGSNILQRRRASTAPWAAVSCFGRPLCIRTPSSSQLCREIVAG